MNDLSRTLIAQNILDSILKNGIICNSDICTKSNDSSINHRVHLNGVVKTKNMNLDKIASAIIDGSTKVVIERPIRSIFLKNTLSYLNLNENSLSNRVINSIFLILKVPSKILETNPKYKASKGIVNEWIFSKIHIGFIQKYGTILYSKSLGQLISNSRFNVERIDNINYEFFKKSHNADFRVFKVTKKMIRENNNTIQKNISDIIVERYLRESYDSFLKKLDDILNDNNKETYVYDDISIRKVFFIVISDKFKNLIVPDYITKLKDIINTAKESDVILTHIFRFELPEEELLPEEISGEEKIAVEKAKKEAEELLLEAKKREEERFKLEPTKDFKSNNSNQYFIYNTTSTSRKIIIDVDVDSSLNFEEQIKNKLQDKTGIPPKGTWRYYQFKYKFKFVDL